MDFRQIFRTSKKDERITQLQGKITTLESDITWLKEQVAAKVERIDELKQDVAAQVERITELEHDAAEYAVASARYVKDIAELQGECLAIASENSDLVTFVRKCATGANIRADKPGGAKLVSDARALIKQYDCATVKEQSQ